MKFDARDWQRLQFPCLMLGLVIIIVSMLIWFTGKQQLLAEAALQKQNAELGQARSRYQASGAEKEAIIKHLPGYQKLIERGFVGEERRIEWIDALRNINQQYKLFGINYTIDTQETYQPAFRLDSGKFELQRSVMKIVAGLLHEGDLFTILDALAAQNFAPFMVRECEVTRVGSGIKNKFLPNLNAKCEIDWLTASEPLAGGKAK